MLVFRKEIIKDNYVQDVNPQLTSFTGLEWGRKADLSSLVEKTQISF